MNSLLNALDNLSTLLGTAQSPVVAGRIRRIIVGLLHNNEFDLSRNDPNHPYTRFGARNNATGNFNRLHQAVQEIVSDGNNDLQPCVNLMFESTSSDTGDSVYLVLRRYRNYVHTIIEDSSDSDSDSDSS